MKQKSIYRGEWAGCSDLTERRKELKRNHESEELKSLKERLDAGWKAEVTDIKRKRPRIQKEAFKIVMVLGKPMKLTIQEYKDHWTFGIQK